jgi:hypothetical protein
MAILIFQKRLAVDNKCMNTELLIQIIGWIGTGCILYAYWMTRQPRALEKTHIDEYLNFFGALCIGINVFFHQAWPAFALQCAWMVIALITFFRQKDLKNY